MKERQDKSSTSPFTQHIDVDGDDNVLDKYIPPPSKASRTTSYDEVLDELVVVRDMLTAALDACRLVNQENQDNHEKK